MFPLGRESNDRSVLFLQVHLAFCHPCFKADKEPTCKPPAPGSGRGNYASAGGISQSLWGKWLTPKPFSSPHLSATSATPPVASSLAPCPPSQPRRALCIRNEALVTATLFHQHRFPQAQRADKAVITRSYSATGRTRGEIQRG